eukprot:214107_1
MVSYDYVGEPWKDWVIFLFEIVCDALVLILFILWVIKIKSATKKIKTKFYYITSILCYAFILLCITAIIFRIYGRYLIHNKSPIYKTIISTNPTFTTKDLIHLSVHAFHYLCFIALYVIFIGRLYFIFEHTMYSIIYDKIFLVLISIFLISVVSIMSCVEYSYSPWYHAYHKNSSTKNEIRAYMKFTLACLDVTLNVMVFFWFQRKLKRVLLSLDYSDLKNEEDDDNQSLTTSLINLQSQQLSLLKLMTKQTILFTLIIMFNEIYWILSGYIDYTTRNSSSLQHKQADIYTYIAQGIQGVVIAIILFLTFQVNDNMYHKLCGCCQRSCYKYFVTKTKREIKQIINLKTLTLNQPFQPPSDLMDR